MKQVWGTLAKGAAAAFAAFTLAGCATPPGTPVPRVDARTDSGTRVTGDGRGNVGVRNGEDGARVGPNGVEIVDRDRKGTNRVLLGKDGKLCVDVGQLFGGKVKLGNICPVQVGTPPAKPAPKPAADSGLKF